MSASQDRVTVSTYLYNGNLGVGGVRAANKYYRNKPLSADADPTKLCETINRHHTICWIYIEMNPIFLTPRPVIRVTLSFPEFIIHPGDLLVNGRIVGAGRPSRNPLARRVLHTHDTPEYCITEISKPSHS